MSLKEILTASFAVADADADSKVTNQFFRSEASDESADYEYLEDESREFFYYLQNKGIKFKHETNYGGEGMGDQYWSVYSFTDGKETVYIKFDGWYQSYNGSEFTEWFFVEPKQVAVTKFTRIK